MKRIFEKRRQNSIDNLKERYPLHWLVWYNDYNGIQSELTKKPYDLERKDPRGRTALMLAVTLGHLESASILLQHNANADSKNKEGSTVVHEAVSYGDVQLLKLVLEKRNSQRWCSQLRLLKELSKIRHTPDFYVEIKWEYTSWFPLVCRMYPKDTYKVYKSGSSIRIDTTLTEFDQIHDWKRERKSFVMKSFNEKLILMWIYHESKEICVEEINIPSDSDASETPDVSSKTVEFRLASPIITTYIDLDKISFTKNKSSLLNWKNDQTDIINGYECRMFTVNDIELVTKTRTEHLRKRCQIERPFSGMKESESTMPSTQEKETNIKIGNPFSISPEDYFNETVNLEGKDIGRRKEMSKKTKKLKTINLWLCEDYPLSFSEQLTPIFDFLASHSSNFARIRDFVTLIPPGFPVKIEIPVFYNLVNARITFDNIFAISEPVPGITQITKDKAILCSIDDSFFENPPDYVNVQSKDCNHMAVGLYDELLLQYAIHQSLTDVIYKDTRVTSEGVQRAQLPRAIQQDEVELQNTITESMARYLGFAENLATQVNDLQLMLALKFSQYEDMKENQQRLYTYKCTL